MGKILYQSDYALLTYHKIEKVLKLEWKMKCPEKEYKIVFMEVTNIVSTNKVHFFLSDIRNAGTITIESLNWLKKEIIPKATELGVQKIGLILNDELFSKIYANSIRTGLENSNIPISFFNLENEALSWLLS